MAFNSRQDIYVAIEDERECQDALYGDHDLTADADHWWDVIGNYNDKFLDGSNREVRRHRLVQIAALAVAALEVEDAWAIT